MESNQIKAFILANNNNVVTKALEKLLVDLLGIEVSSDGPEDCNILVMADGEKYDNDKTKDLKFSDNAKIFYLEWKDAKKTEYKHNLYFLTHILPTYRIPLESFSIIELARRIIEVKSKPDASKSKPNEIYRAVIIALNNHNPVAIAPKVFSEYLHNSRKYIEGKLHGKNKLGNEVIDDILQLDYTASLLKVPKDIELNVLVVENNPDENFNKELKNLKGYFTKIKFYLIKHKFNALKQYLNNGKGDEIKGLINEDDNGIFSNGEGFDFNQVDLILQDIFLEEGEISGTDLADLYFSLAPQAMVFFLTSMDVETLAAYGFDRNVDRIISKRRIKGLIMYYYERFHELYGPLLWYVFVNAPKREETPVIKDITSIRRLLANIRSWILEPGILFHGYALPEMVDHEFRHTYGLWNMTNKILGPFYDRIDKLEAEEIILLSLAIWLHDIGHRGDEHHYEPMSIRDNHASISESLILENYETFGLDWLKKFCGTDCNGAKANRNKTGACCNNEGAICPIRRLGLLCRYHSSNAPLTNEKLSELMLKNKIPSPYCIVGMKNFREEEDKPHNEQIDGYLNNIEDFESYGVTIRCLRDFNDDNLLQLAGLLRWLDALHTHYEKVGSLHRVKSQFKYLAMREKYCNKRIDEIDDKLQKTVTGSESYLGLLEERLSLNSYSQLLAIQYLHMWRSGMVKDIYGEWFWDDNNTEWNYRIVFQLFEKPHFMSDYELTKKTYKIHNDNYGNSIKDTPVAFWMNHVHKEVIVEEEESQMINDGKKALFDKYFCNVPLSYWYIDANGDRDRIKSNE